MTPHRRILHLGLLCLVAAALLPLLTACAHGPRDRRVLIMDFENSIPGGEKEAPYASALAEMVTGCLANSPRIAVLDRQDLGSLLNRVKGPRALSWQAIGRRANADYVIVGSIARLDQNYLVNARLLSVKTGEIVKGSSISRYAKREEDIYPAVQAICYVLGYQLKYLAELYDAQSNGRHAPAPPQQAEQAAAPGAAADPGESTADKVAQTYKNGIPAVELK